MERDLKREKERRRNLRVKGRKNEYLGKERVKGCICCKRSLLGEIIALLR
jgi:hypothetical protein